MRFVHRFLPALALLFACSLTTGCSTILGGGGNERVTFTSKVPGTHVQVYDHKNREIHAGDTPTTARLHRGQGYFTPAKYKVVATAPGLGRSEQAVKAGFNGMYVGNVVFGGLLGILVVDPLTGAMWDLPNTVTIKTGPPSSPGSPVVQTSGSPGAPTSGLSLARKPTTP